MDNSTPQQLNKRTCTIYPTTPKRARTTPTNKPPNKPSKKVRFAEHKETQTNTTNTTDPEHNSTTKPISPLKSTMINRYGTIQQSIQLNQEQLELRIQPSPEPGREIIYSYEYPLIEKMDEDWQYYLQLYDDEAEALSQ